MGESEHFSYHLRDKCLFMFIPHVISYATNIKERKLKSFQNLEILFTVQVSHMQHFLKMNKHEISKKKEKKMHIIFSKIAIYKNRAYKYCTAIVSKNILLQNS